MSVDIFIFNVIGFFIQFFPCPLIIFFPFSEEAYRFERKRIFAGMISASALLALMLPVVIYAPAAFYPDWDMSGAAHLYVLLAILLMFAAFIWLVQESLMKKMMIFFSVMFNAAAQYWLVNMLAVLFSGTSLSRPITAYNMLDVLLYPSTAAILLPVEFFAVIRPLAEFNHEIRPETMKREYLAAILSTSACYSLMGFCSVVWQTVFGKSKIHLLWLLPVSLFLIVDQAVIYWMVFQESISRQRINERQRFLEVQRLQYEKIANEIENTSRLRHDLRHHLNTLGALNAQGKQAEITKYLRRYGVVFEQLKTQKFSSNPVVESILDYYLTLAQNARIEVEHHVTLKGRSGIDPVDMTVLLGNCLENALEALRQLPEGERRLSIELMPAKSMLILRIQNTCAETPDSKGAVSWMNFPSSKGTFRRGMGLRSVTDVAEKYGGNAQFQCADGVFTARVILNPKQKRAAAGGRLEKEGTDTI